MVNEDILNKEVGNIEKKALEPKPVVIAGTSVEDVKGKKGGKKEGQVVGQKIILMCKHPDKEEIINISQAKFIKGDSVKTTTTWINLDEEGNIQMGSTIASLLEKANVKTIKELEGKELQTEADAEGYLCIKLY